MYYIKLTNWLHNKAQRTLCLSNWRTENQERGTEMMGMSGSLLIDQDSEDFSWHFL